MSMKQNQYIHKALCQQSRHKVTTTELVIWF